MAAGIPFLQLQDLPGQLPAPGADRRAVFTQLSTEPAHGSADSCSPSRGATQGQHEQLSLNLFPNLSLSHSPPLCCRAVKSSEGTHAPEAALHTQQE